jgi:hypothetical protein
MHDKNLRRRFVLAAFFLAACSATSSAETVTLFRVFLNDGTAVVSYGEYTRVGDRVVFSMPIGSVSASASGANLHVVNIPAAAVNWTATTTYANSARYAHYIATSAEADYAAVAGEVAATLNAIVLAKEPRARLDMATAARRRLALWPRDHYGYRADDVREMLTLLDDAISALRVAAGETAFSLDLVATAHAPEPVENVPMMRNPTLEESISQAMAVVKVTDVAADRVSILQRVVATLDNSRNDLPNRWVDATRKGATWTIADEARTERQYTALTSSLLKRATEAAARADVRDVEGVIDSIGRRDARLGKKRPDEVNALIAQVHVQLDAARRLRLARDRWQERVGSFRVYMKAVTPIVDSLRRAQRSLDDIKRLAGSEPTVLVALGTRLSTNAKTLGAIAVPDELKPAHALLVSAVNLADSAVKGRRQAVISGELPAAWDASSAAAGSMMLLAKAREDMEAAVKLPQIR